ncbi:hypothetical protein F5884DRAFT_220733 [Xylogone sp. PMI_703]|nr:hypothetical protein F5884DRAFT_220733 [Xylogone sp. PMI_703]
MYSKAVLVSAIVAIAEARFGQEQVPIPAIQAVTSGGQPGQAATLAGQSVSTLLAATNACAKLQQADLIISELGTGADAVAAAIGLVAAEKNFNPFQVSIPSICSDPTLPATQILRGIVPLIDPAVVGSDVENALSAQSQKTPFDATGLSVADVMAAHGFTNFTTQALDGTTGTAPAAGKAVAAPPAASSAAAVVSSAPVAKANSVSCGSAVTTFVTVTRAAAATSAAATTAASSAASSSSSSSSSSSNSGVQKSTIAGLDFGLCVPTMKFEAGLNGRSDTEFTFQAIDPLVNKGQQEALNPNIITNRICDQLTNVCEANDAAKSACLDAKAQIQALGTMDVTTADAWNTALGFQGTDTNPDNAPQPGLIGHS